MKLQSILFAIAAAAATVPTADAQRILWATNVQTVNGWDFESRAEGNPGDLFCDSSPTTYAVNPSSNPNSAWLIADNFENYIPTPGMGIDRVRVNFLARYRFQPPTTGDIEWRMRWQELDGSFNANTIQSRQITSSSQDCEFVLSGSQSNVTGVTNWTVAKVNSIRLRFRRQNGDAPNSALRMKAFRIEVFEAPDCDGNGLSDRYDVQVNGAPDVNGNLVPDFCECVVTPGCTGLPNSTGQVARLQTFSIPSFQNSSFRFRLDRAPAGSFVLAWHGAPMAAPQPAFDGLRCFGGSGAVRFFSGMMTSDAGAIDIPVNFGSAQFPTSLIGTTRTVQVLYRDTSSQGANWTSALNVTFCP